MFEGLDRSGKSTQVEKLLQYFKSRKQEAKDIRYPNRESQSGKLLNQYLKSKEGEGMGHEAVHLLFAMNRWEEKKQIMDMLDSGTHLICDRYAYSGVSYSLAKGLSFDWCCGADRGLIMPDLVIYFQASAD